MTLASSVSRLAVSHPDKGLARRPYAEVKRVHIAFKSELVRQSLADMARRLVGPSGYAEIETRTVWEADVESAGMTMEQLRRMICSGLIQTGVLGQKSQAYRINLESKLDALVCNGCAYHNDTFGDWPVCLFWVLCLDATKADFVMPDVGVRYRLMAGDLIVFDPCLAHAVCRTKDKGKAVKASFKGVGEGLAMQTFLSGELEVSERRWSMLGAPWRKKSTLQGRMDLYDAKFDEETGALVEATRL